MNHRHCEIVVHKFHTTKQQIEIQAHSDIVQSPAGSLDKTLIINRLSVVFVLVWVAKIRGFCL